eukprot:COSAG02_NODE_6586_length_3476_cov_2.239266_6_plen_53_part_01
MYLLIILSPYPQEVSAAEMPLLTVEDFVGDEVGIPEPLAQLLVQACAAGLCDG